MRPGSRCARPRPWKPVKESVDQGAGNDRVATVDPLPVTMFTAPAGTPASWRNAGRSRERPGGRVVEGLAMTELPP
jgi:hypothetical protein